jgi:hypothetical protein
MKSKLLQKMTFGVNQSREVADRPQENIEYPSTPWRERENPTGRIRPATGTQARKDLPVS